jgi:hypothetical protein
MTEPAGTASASSTDRCSRNSDRAGHARLRSVNPCNTVKWRRKLGESSKLPMTEVMGFPPRWGFGPHSTTVTGGMHAQRSAGGDCSVSSSVLSPGFIRRGVGVWKRTFATATRRGDRLAHSTLIQRDLPSLHRNRKSRERRGVIRSTVRGLPTEAPAPAPFWLRCSTMRDTPRRHECSDSKPPAGQSAVAPSASDALAPTAEAGGFRATQL